MSIELPKLKIFASKEFLPQNTEHCTLLIPFWGYEKESNDSPDFGRFDGYEKIGNQYFEIVTEPTLAAIFLLPVALEKKGASEKLDTLIPLAKQHKKKVIVFFNSDSDEKLPYDDTCIIFRTSFYQSTRLPYEYALPGWSIDPLKLLKLNELPKRTKNDKPTIGYCGYVDYVGTSDYFKKKLKSVLNNHKIPIWNTIRGSACRVVLNSKKLVGNIVYRNQFYGIKADFDIRYFLPISLN